MVQRTSHETTKVLHLGLFLALAEAAVLPAMVQPKTNFALKLLHATDESKSIVKGAPPSPNPPCGWPALRR